MGASSSTAKKRSSGKHKLGKIDAEMVADWGGGLIGRLDLAPPTPESDTSSGIWDPAASSPASSPMEWVDPVKVFKQRVVDAGVLKSIPGMPNSSNEPYLECVVQLMKVEYWGSSFSSLIFEEGTRATCCFVVLDGTVSIMATTGEEAWPQEKGKKTAMEWFGEESLDFRKDNLRYSYSAVATEDENGDGVTTLCLNISEVRAVLERDPADVVAEDIARRSARAVAKANSKMSQIRRSLTVERD